MNGKTHLTFAIATSATLAVLCDAQISPYTDTFLFVGLATLGSIFPDIDTEDSKIAKLLPETSLLFRKMKHRTYTHDLALWGIISAFILYKGWYFMLGFLFGVFTHLFLDAFTKMGIPVLCLVKIKKPYKGIDGKWYTKKEPHYIRLLPKKICARSNSVLAVVYTGLLYFGFLVGLTYLLK